MAKMHKPSDKAKMEKPAGGGSFGKPSAKKDCDGDAAMDRKQSTGKLGGGIASKNKKYGY